MEKNRVQIVIFTLLSLYQGWDISLAIGNILIKVMQYYSNENNSHVFSICVGSEIIERRRYSSIEEFKEDITKLTLKTEQVIALNRESILGPVDSLRLAARRMKNPVRYGV